MINMINRIIKALFFIPIIIHSMQNPGLSELRGFSSEEQNALKELAQKHIEQKEAEKRWEEEKAEEEAKAQRAYTAMIKRMEKDEEIRKKEKALREEVDKQVSEQMPWNKVESFNLWLPLRRRFDLQAECCMLTCLTCGVSWSLSAGVNLLTNSLFCSPNDTICTSDLTITKYGTVASSLAICTTAIGARIYANKRHQKREALRNKLLEEKKNQ